MVRFIPCDPRGSVASKPNAPGHRGSPSDAVIAPLESLTRSNQSEALAYAATRPFENAFVQWVLESGYGYHAPDQVWLDRRPNQQVRGLVYIGSQLMLVADDDVDLDAVAHLARLHPYVRSVVAPSRLLPGLWRRIASTYPQPTLRREHQPVSALWPEHLASLPTVEIRRARIDETLLVAEHSAEMIAVELGYDPRAHRASFVSSIRRAIELGWWWVWIVEGELRFQCNVGARTSITAQIQGVWTPPQLRGRGFATLALASIARTLLRESPTVSLYANDFNHPANALYAHLGFVHVGELATYLLP